MKHYVFDGFRLEPDNHLLLRRGEPIALAPKAFDTLVYLIENHGRLVAREELMRAVWPDTFVDTANLTVYISLLRKALEEDGGPRYIETVPRKGYRLNAEVQVVDEDSVPAPAAVAPVQPRARRVPGWAVAATIGMTAAVIWLVAMTVRRAPELKRTRLTSFGPEMAVTAGAISPDGKTVAYANAGGVFVQQIDTGESHPLRAPAAGLTVLSINWFPDGSKLVATGYAPEEDSPQLWMMHVMGEGLPVLIGEGLDATVAPDGKLIAIGASRAGIPEIRLMHPDGEGLRTVATGNSGETFGPVAWAGDGRNVMWVRYRWDPQQRRNSGSIDEYDVETGKRSTVLSGSDFAGSVINAAGRVVYAQALGANPSSKYGGRLFDLNSLGRAVRIADAEEPIAELSASASGSLMVRHAVAEHSVFVADSANLGQAHRLTLGMGREDFPRAWTPDSRAVLFDSNRNGTWQIFKQPLDAATDEPVTHSAEDLFSPRLSPDGRSLLYLDRPKNWHEGEPVSIVRTPVAGGPAEVVLKETGIGDWGLRFECAAVAGGPCVLAKRVGNQIVFRTFEGREVARVEGDEAHPIAWTIAPDGSRLAWARWDSAEARIHELPVASSAQTPDVVIKGMSHIHSLHWSADGAGWYVTSAWPASWRISFVSPDGTARVLTRGHGNHAPDVFPSPDGRHVAWSQLITESNLWLLQGL